jgi:hypothetical protein
MKSKYWTCSKFADWLRGTPKPPMGTGEIWNAWEKTAKTKKFRYWLAEEGLDYLQNLVGWSASRINDVRCYINNRWVIKKHALTSNLEPGKWYDFDTRLLHAVFDELVNFVEIEQAWMQVVFSEEECKKYKTPWYRTIFRIGFWRSPEAGIAYLEWAAGLKIDEDCVDKNDPNFGRPTFQALAAQETLVLYNWWKKERPKRLDPSEASGWSEYCEENRKAAKIYGNDPVDGFIINKTEDDPSRSILSIYHKIEKEQEEEDTAMLIRLIRIRQSLWT